MNQNQKDNITNAVPVTSATPEVPAAPVEVIPGASVPELQALLTLLLNREKKTLQQEQADEVSRRARNAQRVKSSIEHDKRGIIRQAKCPHQKGGAFGNFGRATDFAVYQHTYINGDVLIKCMVCQMKWRPADTGEFLVRNGRKISNHTRIGWNDGLNGGAVQMFKQSSNRASSSEVPMVAKPVEISKAAEQTPETAEDFQL